MARSPVTINSAPPVTAHSSETALTIALYRQARDLRPNDPGDPTEQRADTNLFGKGGAALLNGERKDRRVAAEGARSVENLQKPSINVVVRHKHCSEALS